MSAEEPKPEAEPEVTVTKLAAPRAQETRHQEGKTIPISGGMRISFSLQQTDAIKCAFAHVSSITQAGSPPAEFGLTNYNFAVENFAQNHVAGTPGSPAAPGKPPTPATSPFYEVNADIRETITFQVAAHGRTNIASDADPSITQMNYTTVVNDLTPSPAAVNTGGLSLFKNQPRRNKFWAEDLTIKHERFHADEDQKFGGQAVKSAQTWLNTKTANTDEQLEKLLVQSATKIRDAMKVAMAAPASEQRAYDDGASAYSARAKAIKTKGDANGYAPKPPAPAPTPAPAPAPHK